MTLSAAVLAQVEKLAGRKTLTQIANGAGFTRVEVMEGVMSGRVRLQLDQAVALARSLELDERELLILAIRQYVPADLVNLLTEDPRFGETNANTKAAVTAAQVVLGLIDSHSRQAQAAAGDLLQALSAIEDRLPMIRRGLQQLADDAVD